MKLPKLNVGLVGVYLEKFPGDAKGEFKKTLRQMEKLAKELDFNLYPVPTPLETSEEVAKACQELATHNLDFILVQTSSLAAGELIYPFARLKGHIGLWALPESQKEGLLPLNSLCGINLYASNIGHYLKGYEKPVKWFYGYTDNELFRKRFEITLKSLRTIKGLKTVRIGLVGGVAQGFDDFWFDERQLREKFGVEIFQLHEISEIVQKAKSLSQKEIKETVECIHSEADSINVSDEEVEKSARLYLAFEELARQNEYDALAISCWPKLQEQYQIAPCSVLGRLNENGIVAACEGDVVSAISMLILNYLNNQPSTLMDLATFDESDETILFWHCGCGLRSWANKDGIKLDKHFNLYADGERAGVVHDMVFKAQPTTIFRTTQDGKQMLLFTADIIDPVRNSNSNRRPVSKRKNGITSDTEISNGVKGKQSYQGSRGWFGNLKFAEDQISVRDLINTIMVHKFPHHYPIATGNLTNELMELAAWLGIKPLEKVAYQPYLQEIK